MQKGEHFLLDKEDKVANVNGSSAQSGNWKKYWCEHTGKSWPSKCCIHSCGNKPTVGGHVYINGEKGNQFYFILPICQSCNKDPNMNYGAGWASVKSTGSWVVVLNSHDGCYNA